MLQNETPTLTMATLPRTLTDDARLCLCHRIPLVLQAAQYRGILRYSTREGIVSREGNLPMLTDLLQKH
jgi:hypothetical protein